jgi:lysophospholipase L1-like esterase
LGVGHDELPTGGRVGPLLNSRYKIYGRSRLGALALVLAVVTVVFVAKWRAGAEGLSVVAFGDSTTSGLVSDAAVYPKFLQESLRARGIAATVINSGSKGNTTRDAIARLDHDVLSLAPDIVIVQFGLNDAAVDLHLGKDHPRVPLAEFRRSMETVVDKLQAQGARVVLMTPNPVIWTPSLLATFGRFPYRPDERWGYNVLVSDYAESVRELALKRGVPVHGPHEALAGDRGQWLGAHEVDDRGRDVDQRDLLRAP